MTGIILAAGYATRMYPLTRDYPKPLLSVGGKAIIDWLYEDMRRCGISRIYVVTNHRFVPFFSSWAAAKDNVTVIDDMTQSNETRLGALRDIALVLREGSIDESVFVLAGDNVLDFSFRPFLEYAEMKGASCVMRHFQPDEEKLRKTGVCTVDDDSLILSMEEKPLHPKSSWAVPPFYYYRKEDIGLLPEAIENGLDADAPGSFVSYLASRRKVYAWLMSGKRYDVGTISGYERIRDRYRGPVE